MLRPDLDQPIELRFRGDTLDVVGAMMAMIVAAVEGGIDNERAKDVVVDLQEQLNQQVNAGHFKREAQRMLNGDDVFDYRGIQVLVDEFDARHPKPAGSAVDQLTPLEDMDWYVILGRSEYGFEAAGYPEHLDVESSMLMASFIRTYARDLENVLDEASDPDGLEGRDVA